MKFHHEKFPSNTLINTEGVAYEVLTLLDLCNSTFFNTYTCTLTKKMSQPLDYI